MHTEPNTAETTCVAVGGHDRWMTLTRNAYRRLADAFAALDEDDWGRPTPCEGWTVRDMGGHIVGAMRSAARFRELARSSARSRRGPRRRARTRST